MTVQNKPAGLCWMKVAATIVFGRHKSFTCVETHAPSTHFVHWIVCKLPPSRTAPICRKQLINGSSRRSLEGVWVSERSNHKQENSAVCSVGKRELRVARDEHKMFAPHPPPTESHPISLNTAASVSPTAMTIRRQENLFLQFTCLHGRKWWLTCSCSHQTGKRRRQKC